MQSGWYLKLAWLGIFVFAGHAQAVAQGFEDVTERVGVTGLSGGVASWVDYNNDGWTDLYVSGQLWKNDQGAFTLIEGHGLSGTGVWADLNNDGAVDFFRFQVPSQVYLSQIPKGKTEFLNVPNGIPKELPMEVSLGAALADFDGDGKVDIYLGGYEIWQKASYHDLVLFNQGDGVFKEVWRTEGTPRPARGIITCDFDEDGDMDVYVSNYRLARNFLWVNDGKGKLVNQVEPLGLTDEGSNGYFGHTIGSSTGDLDNDGHFDLFVGNFSHPPEWQDRPRFFRNLGKSKEFKFEEKTDKVSLRWQESYASPTFGDFDNDGNLDLFFTTVYSGDFSVLYHNQGEWIFREVTEESGIKTAQTYQAAWADFDQDGFLDLVSGGRLFKNPGTGGAWLTVKLVDGKHRSLEGTQVRLRLEDKVLTRQVSCSTGQGNQNDSVLHFGLGASPPDQLQLEIRWPDGLKQLVNAKPNSRNVITYPTTQKRE